MLVVDRDTDFLESASLLLADEDVVTVRSLDDAAAVVAAGGVDVVLIGPSHATLLGVAEVAESLAVDPRVAIVLAAPIVTNRLLRTALRHGLADVVDTPMAGDDLAEVIGRIRGRASRRRSPTAAPGSERAPLDLFFEAAPGAPAEVSTSPSRFAQALPLVESGFDPGDAAMEAAGPAAPGVLAAAGAAGGELAASTVAADAPVPTEAGPEGSAAAGTGEDDLVREPAEPAPAPPPVRPDDHDPPEEGGTWSSTDALSPGAPSDSHQPAPEAESFEIPTVEVPAWFPDHDRIAEVDIEVPPRPESPPPLPQAVTTAPTETRPGSPAPHDRTASGRIVAVVAGRGGSGRTITATNLAVALTTAAGTERAVALVDADLHFGDLAAMLRLNAVPTIVEAARDLDGLAETPIDTLLQRHPSGVRVLPAPLGATSGGLPSPKDIVQVVERIARIVDHVVVDTPPVFDESLITVLDHADDVVVVADMDPPSVKDTTIALEALRAADVPVDRVHLVVNRVNAKTRLAMVELERSLGLEVVGSVPADPLVARSVDEGVPAVTLAPESAVAAAFADLARRLVLGSTRP